MSISISAQAFWVKETEVIAVTNSMPALQTAIQNITTFQEVLSDFDWMTAPQWVDNPQRHGPFEKLIYHANHI